MIKSVEPDVVDGEVHNSKTGILSNPLDLKKIFSLFINLFKKFLYFLLLIIYLFFTITITLTLTLDR